MTTVSTAREVGTTISAGGKLTLDAGRDVNVRAATVAAGGDLGVRAGRDVTIESGRDRADVNYTAQWTDRGTFSKTSNTVQAEVRTDNAVGSSFTGKNVSVQAGNDVNISGSYVSAQDKLSISAQRDVNIEVANNSSSSSVAVSKQTSPTGLGRAVGSAFATLSTIEILPNPMAATLLTNKGVRDNAVAMDSTVTGSLITGGTVDIQSGRNTTITGSSVIADNDVRIAAGNNLTIQSAQETRTQGRATNTSASGNVGTFLRPAVGAASSSNNTAQISTVQVGSVVASLNGNVALSSGNAYTQTASDIYALGTGADGKAGNIAITAKTVTINSADNTSTTLEQSRQKSSTIGGTATASIVNTAKSINNTVQAMGKTSDSRAQALGTAVTAYNAYQLGSSIANGSVGNASVGVAFKRDSSSSMSVQTESVPVGSTVAAAGNVSITAIGGGSASNINVVGSKISGENVALAADNAVNLVSAVGKSQNTSTSNSSGMSGGAAISVGTQTGLVFQGGLYQASGNKNGLSTTNYNTEVTGSKSVSIVSGGNTTMQGAVVTGEKVSATVGGNLNIISPQDMSFSTASSGMAGANVSLCVWWCWGTPVEGSLSGGSSGANSNYVSVGSEQSGIQAGNGGFNVAVAGNTNLVGGVIASTQAAVDKGANSFDTGSLTMTNVTNTASYGGSGWSVTAGYNAPSSAGIGSAGGQQTGVSMAGISGIAGNTAVRTGDPSGGIKPPPSASDVLADVNSQIIITNAASAAAIQASSSLYGNRTNTGLTYEYESSGDDAPVAEGRYARGDMQITDPAEQLDYVRQISQATADYVDQMKDKCPACSREGYNKMNIAVSPMTGLEAGFNESTMATYDPKTNTATVFQNFFTQAAPLQASVLFHEYIHSLSENQALITNSTPEERKPDYPYPQRPWEKPAIELERLYQLRFGQTIYGRFK